MVRPLVSVKERRGQKDHGSDKNDQTQQQRIEESLRMIWYVLISLASNINWLPTKLAFLVTRFI